MKKYTPKNKTELKALVGNLSVYLGDIDTSAIADMSELFKDTGRKDFAGIDSWDVSKCENMRAMFYKCRYFKEDISSWDVSNVVDMSEMFSGCFSFNQSLAALIATLSRGK